MCKEDRYLSEFVGNSEQIGSRVFRLAVVDLQTDHSSGGVDEVYSLRWTYR